MLFEQKTEIQNALLQMQLKQEKKSAIFTYLNFLEQKNEQGDGLLPLLQAEVERLKASMSDLEAILQRTDRSGRRQQ